MKDGQESLKKGITTEKTIFLGLVKCFSKFKISGITTIFKTLRNHYTDKGRRQRSGTYHKVEEPSLPQSVVDNYSFLLEYFLIWKSY